MIILFQNILYLKEFIACNGCFGCFSLYLYLSLSLSLPISLSLSLSLYLSLSRYLSLPLSLSLSLSLFLLHTEGSLEKWTQFELVFWFQEMSYVSHVVDEDILCRNNDGELDQELDSNSKLTNVSQNRSIYNIKCME